MMLKKEANKRHNTTSDGKDREAVLSYTVLQPTERRANQLSEQLSERTRELERLREYVMRLEQGERGLVQELTQQLAMKDEGISSIAALYAKKEAENRKLAAQLESLIGLQRQHAGKIKELLLKKEEETARLVEGLMKLLETKNSEVSSLRNSLLELGKSQSLPSLSSTTAYVQQMQVMRHELESRNSEIKKLEKAFTEEQKLSKSIQARLKEQLSQVQTQTEELKVFLIEKEKLAQNLESAFEKRLAAKEEELRQLKSLIHAKPETKLHRQVDELKSELHLKEETSKLMSEEIAKLREQSSLLRKRLEERQRIFFESEKSYEELIAKLREQHDGRIKAFLQESSQKELTLKAALEEEKTKLQRETALMKEKEKQIEETLQAFAMTSQQLINLGSSAAAVSEPESSLIGVKEGLKEKEKQLDEKAKYLNEKEAELKNLLATAEAKIAEIKEKEASMERKEQLLLKEQEALNKELEVLTSAGIEISRSKQYIQQKLASIGFEQPAQQQMQQPKQQITTPVETAEFIEEQPYQKQPMQQYTSAQELGLGGGAGGVQEAEEEEGSDAPKFTGITSGAPGASAGEVKEALEEGEDFAPSAETSIKKAPTAAISAARKDKAAVTPKAQKSKKFVQKQKILAKKLKPTVKKDLKQRKQPKTMPKRATGKIPPMITAAAKEVPKGLRLPEELRGKEGQELFTELGGYSEIDEIKSIVEVGLQHGDSIEQIRQSLLTSGYSKQNIEKALSGALSGGVKK